MKPLSQEFYLLPTITVAKSLLGKYFVRRINNKILIGKIVETEAYLQNDPASHSFRKKTDRNKVMFEKGGCLYVYFTYGMYYCSNIVTNIYGKGEAVLIRAVEPLYGIKEMMINRYGKNYTLSNKTFINLTNGPAKFSKAFALSKNENGVSVLNGKIFISEGETIKSSLIKKSSRIGIKTGIEKQWRFFIDGNKWVSK